MQFRPRVAVWRLWFESWDLSDWHLSLAERGEVITNTDSPKLLARHLLLCYTDYAQNYHRQTNVVWLSVVVAMLHKQSWAQWCFVLAFKMSTGLSLNFALTQLKQYCHHFEHKLCLYFPHFQKSQQTHYQPSISPLRNDLRRASTISSSLLWSMWSMWSTSKDRFFRFESLSRFP